MDPSETLSPGAGAFYGLEDYMAKQAAQKHQTLLDNLAVQKAAHETDNERLDYDLRKQEVADRERQYENENRWKIEAAKTTAAKEAKSAQDLDDYINSQPMGSPQRMAAEAKRAGATINPSEFAPKTPAMVPVFGHNAKGQVVDAQGNVVTQVPQGAKIEPIAPEKPTKEPTAHYTVQAQLDDKGKPTGKFIRVDSLTGEISPAPMTGGAEGALTKPPPGASVIASKESAKKEVLPTLTSLDATIDDAAKKDLIGPSSGRISELEMQIGNADPTTARLATLMRVVRLQFDAGLGGARAAASPKLAEQWNGLMEQKATPENLHAVVEVLREIMGDETKAPSATTKKGATSPADLWKQYSK